MRSMKLLAAMAVLAAFVAGPVMAQDSDGAMTSGTTSKSTTSSTTAKHHPKKKPVRHKKPTSSSTGTSSTGEGTSTTK